MIDHSEDPHEIELGGWPARAVPVGCVTIDRETWVVVARREAEVARGEIDRPERRGRARPMRICREVLEDGRIRLGRVDPRRDAQLLGFLGEV